MTKVSVPHPFWGVSVPSGFWLAHPHWVHEAEREGRGRWEPAALGDLSPEVAAAVELEIAIIAEVWGAARAPRLWRAVGG